MERSYKPQLYRVSGQRRVIDTLDIPHNEAKNLELIIATLEPKDFVLALWQGGSAAHGSTDEWSDIDIQVIVEDDRVEETFDIIEESLKTLSEIRFKWRVPEPTWHGHSQCRDCLLATPLRVATTLAPPLPSRAVSFPKRRILSSVEGRKINECKSD
jgi:predicted nucleotidyltransferase